MNPLILKSGMTPDRKGRRFLDLPEARPMLVSAMKALYPMTKNRAIGVTVSPILIDIVGKIAATTFYLLLYFSASFFVSIQIFLFSPFTFRRST